MGRNRLPCSTIADWRVNKGRFPYLRYPVDLRGNYCGHCPKGNLFLRHLDHENYFIAYTMETASNGIRQSDNNGQSAAGWLPETRYEGITNPVVMVIRKYKRRDKKRVLPAAPLA